MVGLQAIPPIAWVVLVLIWLPHPARAIVAIVVISALPAVAVATAASVRHVPPVLVRAGRTFGATGWELQRNIILPAAVPGYFSGLQQAWALGWHALLAAELIVAGAVGLGLLLDTAKLAGDTSLVLATMVIIVIIGLAVDFVLTRFDRRIRRRRGLMTPA
jgi:NitT/TauT family transport system permease protein